jgi:hypothetical protein
MAGANMEILPRRQINYTRRNPFPPFWLHFLMLICLGLGPPIVPYLQHLMELWMEQVQERFYLHGPLRPPSLYPVPERTPTFQLFPYLPAELRLHVWSLAVPPARLLLLQLPMLPEEPSWHQLLPRSLNPSWFRRRKPNYGRPHTFTCHTPPPALLSVNFEARAVALKRYQLAFAPAGGQPKVYIDFERDVVGLSDPVMSTFSGDYLMYLSPDFARVRFLCAAGMGIRAREYFRPNGAPRRIVQEVQTMYVIQSQLLALGTAPVLAGRDWEYWVKWLQRRGKLVVWINGGVANVLRGGVGNIN